jgi:hypothetical protein
MSDYAEHPELPPAERELQDVGPRPIIIGLLLVVFVSLLLAGLSLWMFPTALRDRPANVGVNEFPLPRLQPNTPLDMSRLYAEEMKRLHGTGWVDRTKGLVHIPIDDAMALVAARGIADWPKQPPNGISR